jgi:hypothetical protein
MYMSIFIALLLEGKLKPRVIFQLHYVHTYIHVCVFICAVCTFVHMPSV